MLSLIFNDFNRYCGPCDRACSSKCLVELQLFFINSTIGNQIQKEKGSLKPEIDYPSFYFCACKRQYITRVCYRINFGIAHKTKLTYLYNDAFNTDFFSDLLHPNFYCRICKITKTTLGLNSAIVK